jgi:aspartyl aminopeptidase
LNPQQHLVPVWGTGTGVGTAHGFREFIAGEIGVAASDVAFWDVMFHDLTPPAIVGRDDELLSAPRLDNLCSAWAAIAALSDARADAWIGVVALFDHEEVGSETNRGASSPVLESTLERRDEWRRALSASHCLSADMAHATHPNYADRHEPGHWIAMNGGPVVKTNASQRYATDARSVLPFLDACERAGVPVQHYVNRSDLPCGSTIGPITAARLGITTVDVGAPQLAMHSARELMGAADPALYRAALAAYLTAQG